MVEQLIPLTALRPVRMIREGDEVKVQYLGTRAEFTLSANRPVDVLPLATPDDLHMFVEVMDPKMLVVAQVGEDGERQTLCLSPAAAIQLAQLLGSFLFFPQGIPDLNDDYL